MTTEQAEQAYEEWRKELGGEHITYYHFPLYEKHLKLAFLAGLSSKVKPVNENIVKASKKLLQQFIVDSDDKTGRFNKGKVSENELFDIIAELESALNPPKV